MSAGFGCGFASYTHEARRPIGDPRREKMQIAREDAAPNHAVATVTDPNAAFERQRSVNGCKLRHNARMVKLMTTQTSTHCKVWVCRVDACHDVAMSLWLLHVPGDNRQCSHHGKGHAVTFECRSQIHQPTALGPHRHASGNAPASALRSRTLADSCRANSSG